MSLKWGIDMNKREYVDAKQMIALEEELAHLKQEYGIIEKKAWWVKAGDWAAAHVKKSTVNQKKYLKLALICGWFCGAHCFYARQKWRGILYLAFCWTGIPFAMTLIDLMIAVPMKADESGNIIL